MARIHKRQPGQLLPFRIPFFRIFYSTTYTALYFILLCFLAITPVSLVFVAVEQNAFQYTFMIGGTYVLTALLAIFIYSSRLFTNRTVLAGVGKSYVPVEEGDLGKSVRKMIVHQLERSAIVAWESRPRDVLGELLLLREETGWGHGGDEGTVGREIPVAPADPPWGHVRHAGWSSPGQSDDGEMPDLQFATVVAELPHLIEARAVSLAPSADLLMAGGDAAVAEQLRRPKTMGMRDYLTRLSYLGLVNPPAAGQRFLAQYERARFSGLPITEDEFRSLMSAFADLLSGMTELDAHVLEQVRMQADYEASIMEREGDISPVEAQTDVRVALAASSPPPTPDSSTRSPVTARTAPSRVVTPYLQPDISSIDSFSSVIHRTPEGGTGAVSRERDVPSERGSLDSASLFSDAGSVVIHEAHSDIG